MERFERGRVTICDHTRVAVVLESAQRLLKPDALQRTDNVTATQCLCTADQTPFDVGLHSGFQTTLVLRLRFAGEAEFILVAVTADSMDCRN
jgi:hypothetical protein